MKPVSLFLSGSLLGVFATVGVFYARGPVSRQIQLLRAGGNQNANIAVPLRPNEVSMGDPAAPVTLIEYSDFQCPYCALFRAETLPKIKAKYIDSGRLRFILRHLPLPSHRQAMTASQAAACAGDQGFYWQLTDLMFSRASCLECQGALELSKGVPLERAKFEECVSSERHRAEIDQDIASARQANLRGTPSFIVGRSTSEGVEGVAIRGALGFEEFAAKIERFTGTATTARR